MLLIPYLIMVGLQEGEREVDRSRETGCGCVLRAHYVNLPKLRDRKGNEGRWGKRERGEGEKGGMEGEGEKGKMEGRGRMVERGRGRMEGERERKERWTEGERWWKEGGEG